MSYGRIPTVTSKKRIQATNSEDTALSAPTADYEFHPGDQVIWPQVREGDADSTAPNPVCDPQGGSYHEGF